MKRNAGHLGAGIRRRVGADDARRSTRRALLLAAAAWPALVTPFASLAQPQPARIPRVGLLISGSTATFYPRVEAFKQGLRELGYVEGKNIVIEWRYTEGKQDRLPDIAAELVRLKVDIIVASDGNVIRAAKNATKTIPIVMTQTTDPVELGYVASLARPGGNVTGLSQMSTETSMKGLELLKEAFPKISRVAVLSATDGSTSSLSGVWFRAMEDAAKKIGVTLQILTAVGASGIEGAFSAMTRAHADALA